MVHIFASETDHFPPIKALFELVTSVTLSIFQQGRGSRKGRGRKSLFCFVLFFSVIFFFFKTITKYSRLSFYPQGPDCDSENKCVQTQQVWYLSFCLDCGDILNICNCSCSAIPQHRTQKKQRSEVNRLRSSQPTFECLLLFLWTKVRNKRNKENKALSGLVVDLKEQMIKWLWESKH